MRDIITEHAYAGRDNTNRLGFYVVEDGSVTPVDFAGATRMQLVLVDTNEVIDSDTYSAFFDWLSGEEGEVIFKTNEYPNLKPGEYAVRVVVYDPVHPNGQVLVHEDGGSYSVIFEVLPS